MKLIIRIKKKDKVPANNIARDGPEKVPDKYLKHREKLLQPF